MSPPLLMGSPVYGGLSPVDVVLSPNGIDEAVPRDISSGAAVPNWTACVNNWQIDAADLTVGDDYLYYGNGVYFHTTSTYDFAGVRLTQGGTLIAGKEQIMETTGGTSNADSWGTPVQFAGKLTAAAGETFQLEVRNNGQTTADAYGWNQILINTKDVPNHLHTVDNGPPDDPGNPGNQLTTGVSGGGWKDSGMSFGSMAAGDWLFALQMQVTNFNGSARSGVGLNIPGIGDVAVSLSVYSGGAPDVIGGMIAVENMTAGDVKFRIYNNSGTVEGDVEHLEMWAIPLSDFANHHINSDIAVYPSTEYFCTAQNTFEERVTVQANPIVGGDRWLTLTGCSVENNGSNLRNQIIAHDNVNGGGIVRNGNWRGFLPRYRKADDNVIGQSFVSMSELRTYAGGDNVIFSGQQFCTTTNFATKGIYDPWVVAIDMRK